MGVSIAEIEVHHRPRPEGQVQVQHPQDAQGHPRPPDRQVPAELFDAAPADLRPVRHGRAAWPAASSGLWLSYERLVLKHSIANRPLLLLAVLLIVIGIQFITLGLLAEIMVRAYHESSAKKIYHIKEIIDSDRP